MAAQASRLRRSRRAAGRGGAIAARPRPPAGRDRPAARRAGCRSRRRRRPPAIGRASRRTDRACRRSAARRLSIDAGQTIELGRALRSRRLRLGQDRHRRERRSAAPRRSRPCSCARARQSRRLRLRLGDGGAVPPARLRRWRRRPRAPSCRHVAMQDHRLALHRSRHVERPAHGEEPAGMIDRMHVIGSAKVPLAWSTTKPRSSQLSQSWRATSISSTKRAADVRVGRRAGRCRWNRPPSSSGPCKPGDPAGAAARRDDRASRRPERRETARRHRAGHQAQRPIRSVAPISAPSERQRIETQAIDLAAVAQRPRRGRQAQQHRIEAAAVRPSCAIARKGAAPAKPAAPVTRQAAGCQPWAAREARRCTLLVRPSEPSKRSACASESHCHA